MIDTVVSVLEFVPGNLPVRFAYRTGTRSMSNALARGTHSEDVQLKRSILGV
jgi:hypothetical protein